MQKEQSTEPRTDIKMCREDAIQLASVILRINELPHLRRLQGNGGWARAVHQMIDLLTADNNLDALWVWNRFLWAFGRRNTWEASIALDGLLSVVPLLSNAWVRLSRLHWWQFRKRKAERRNIRRLERVRDNALVKIYSNDLEWSDRIEFNKFAMRGYGL